MVKDDSYWRKNDDRFTARVKRVLSSKIKNADMAKRLACSERYIRKLKEKLRNEELLSRKRGARPALTSNALKNMRKKVKEKGDGRNGPDSGALREFFKEALDETAAERGKISRKQFLSKKSKRKYMKEMNITEVKGQDTTNARREAVQDFRNFISHAAMMNAFGRVSDPSLSFNFDSTQFHIHFGSDEKKHFFVVEEKRNKSKSYAGSGHLPISVKLMWLNNATGNVAPFLFLFADENLSEEEFYVYEVPNLSPSTTAGGRGFISFCKTRNACKGWFQWFMLQIVIPFIQQAQSCLHSSMDKNAFLGCDGEAEQLEAFMHSDITLLLAQAHTILGKYAASLSLSSQPADAGDWFKGTKTKIKDNDCRYSPCSNLDCYLNDAFDEYQETRPPGCKLTPQKIEHMKEILQQVVWASQFTMKRSTVQEGFRRTGQCPVNTDVIFQKCEGVITPQQLEHINDVLPQCSNFFRAHGHLPEREMDRLGIPRWNFRDNTVLDKDERVLHRQRCVAFNLPTRITQYLAYLTERDRRTAIPKIGKRVNGQLLMPDVTPYAPIPTAVTQVVLKRSRTVRENDREAPQVVAPPPKKTTRAGRAVINRYATKGLDDDEYVE